MVQARPKALDNPSILISPNVFEVSNKFDIKVGLVLCYDFSLNFFLGITT